MSSENDLFYKTKAWYIVPYVYTFTRRPNMIKKLIKVLANRQENEVNGIGNVVRL